MKYQFVEKDKDTSILKYKDKEFEFKRDIDLQAKVQGVHSKARTKMFIELSKQGITKDDLVVKTIKNGKTYEDNSNLEEIEKGYVEMAMLDLIDDICFKYTQMKFAELIVDIGMSQENFKEMEQFTTDLTLAISGKSSNSPSK